MDIIFRETWVSKLIALEIESLPVSTETEEVIKKKYLIKSTRPKWVHRGTHQRPYIRKIPYIKRSTHQRPYIHNIM